MKRRKNRFYTVLVGILFLTIAGLASLSSGYETPGSTGKKNKRYEIRIEKFQVLDSIRNRLIPYALFAPVLKKEKVDSIRLVIFSHGYGSNYPKNYLNYSYLTKRLAREGFWTLSIQHELPGDSLIPTMGIIQIVRMPFWKRGEENILFVLNHFKRTNPDLIIRSVDLIGHSNGGDMSVLTAKNHPEFIRKVITLDNLRMPIPNVSKPQFSSLRSVDKKADTLVIPPEEVCITCGIRIIQLKQTTHNQMNDEGSRKQKKQINNYVKKILEDRF
ncbi:MAG: rane-associated esterase [Fluviicola sp.]|jgi:pimeloyl-ACP methyl ester carboxylesterase|uniref:alpha/beta fold hydrolase n=1 Tax=Fluviicola sp. TaxID=1917219 RepID=UPI002633A8FD|nr:alpha/beta hydrolase [Fluviicola sp.]MDF3027410.1 rane-associated esterase [Fluviicola sp.]